MKVTINYGGQLVSVEVSVEVYEFLDCADHKEENLAHEKRRHWDGREFDEHIVFTEGVGVFSELPEDYLCRKETLDELLSVLDRCTETQRRRFLLYALDGMSYTEIADLYGCSKASIFIAPSSWYSAARENLSLPLLHIAVGQSWSTSGTA